MKKLARILLAFLITLALGEAFDLAYLSYVRATITTTASSTTLAGNGSTQVFSYSYVAGQASYIQVTYTNASGIATVLTPSQYTLTINAPATGQVWGIGGTVTYPTIASGQPAYCRRHHADHRPHRAAASGGVVERRPIVSTWDRTRPRSSGNANPADRKHFAI